MKVSQIYSRNTAKRATIYHNTQRRSLTSRGSLGISSIMGISSPFSARFASIAYRNSNFTGRSPISKSSSDWWILLWLSWQSSGDIPAYKTKRAFEFEKSFSYSLFINCSKEKKWRNKQKKNKTKQQSCVEILPVEKVTKSATNFKCFYISKEKQFFKGFLWIAW